MLPDGVRRFFRLGRAKDVSREIDAELEFHIDEKTKALMACGMREDDARAEAIRQFGDLTSRREELVSTDLKRAGRAERSEWWDSVWQDLRFALRGLRRAPGLTASVVIILGLGIGGQSAMYGLLDRVLLRAGPHLASPGELRRIFALETDSYRNERSWSNSFGTADIRALRDALPPETRVGMIAGWRDRLDGPDGEQVDFGLVSGDLFAVLGVRPVRGRLIETADDQSGAEPAAVISYGFWQRRFGGRDDAIGSTVKLGSVTYTVVGVAPRGFSGLRPTRVDLWTPMSIAGQAVYGGQWADVLHIFEAVVRVPDETQLAGLTHATQSAYRQAAKTRRRGDTTAVVQLVGVAPYQRPGGFGTQTRLSLIVAGVSLMLCFIAVANATNLLMLRALERRRETAVRLALGAGRGRLVRAVLMESLLLALGGALAAGLIAAWSGELLRRLIIKNDWQTGVFDARVMAFAGGLALVIGVVTGLLPGWQASRPDAIASLKAGARSGFGRSRLRVSLLVLQSALTVVLLFGTALYVRSFIRASGVDYGIAASELVQVRVEPPRGDTTWGSGRLASLTGELADRVRRMPGVSQVSEASMMPMQGYGAAALRAEGVDSIRFGQFGPFITEVDSLFFGATGMRVLRGRGFTGADVASHAPVAVVNDEMAKALWPGQDPLGKCLYIGSRNEPHAVACRQIVGVVSSHRMQLDDDAPFRNYYIPLGYRWNGMYGHALVVRTNGSPTPLLPGLLNLLRERLPDSEPGTVRANQRIVEREIAPWRDGTKLFGMFAGLAVLLSMGGLYSIIAYGVAQRSHEFGVRIAVGAQGADLVRLVIATALRPVTAGLLAGLVLMLWLVRYVAPLLYHTAPRDPVAILAAMLALLLIAALACIGPARKAAVIDPRLALQAE